MNDGRDQIGILPDWQPFYNLLEVVAYQSYPYSIVELPNGMS